MVFATPALGFPAGARALCGLLSQNLFDKATKIPLIVVPSVGVFRRQTASAISTPLIFSSVIPLAVPKPRADGR
jgi:hypothetical protein